MRLKSKVVLISLLILCLIVMVSCNNENDSLENNVKTNEISTSNDIDEVDESDMSINDETTVSEDEELDLPLIVENQEVFTEELTKIVKRQMYRDESIDLNRLVFNMIAYIGNPDTYLRDELIYTAFHKILAFDILDTEQKKNIFYALLDDDKLMYKVGEENSESVFTRTFSVLILYRVLLSDLENPYLTDEEHLYIYERMTEYLQAEKDYRGYIDDESGWAHSVAHSGDLISALAQYEIIDEEMLLNLLNLIADKVKTHTHEYVDGEPDRLRAGIKVIFDRELISDEALVLWVESIINYEKTNDEAKDVVTKRNIDNFIRSLSGLNEHAINDVITEYKSQIK